MTMLPIVVQMLENYLSTRHKGEWLAGPEFTAADIMMSSTLGLLDFSCQSPTEVPAILTSDKYPVAAAYWDRLQVWHVISRLTAQWHNETCKTLHSVCNGIP